MENLRVAKLLPYAYEALKNDTVINKDGKGIIEKSLRGQISSFGASILTGSLEASVAFYSVQGRAKSPRDALLPVICKILRDGGEFAAPDESKTDLKEIVFTSKDPELSEKIIDASIAIKLAMNFFELK